MGYLRPQFFLGRDDQSIGIFPAISAAKRAKAGELWRRTTDVRRMGVWKGCTENEEMTPAIHGIQWGYNEMTGEHAKKHGTSPF